MQQSTNTQLATTTLLLFYRGPERFVPLELQAALIVSSGECSPHETSRRFLIRSSNRDANHHKARILTCRNWTVIGLPW